FEFVIIGLMLVIVIGFIAGLFVAPPDPAGVLGGIVPRFADSGSVLLAASILGATIMPHAIYAHSALARARWNGVGGGASIASIRTLLTASRWDVSIAMVIAGSVNLAILLRAAANLPGVEGTDSLEGAHAAITDNLGAVIGTLFAVR